MPLARKRDDFIAVGSARCIFQVNVEVVGTAKCLFIHSVVRDSLHTVEDMVTHRARRWLQYSIYEIKQTDEYESVEYSNVI